MPSLDLLVFGPHPDDIEIGLGGVVARHVTLGFRVGLCDLTRGELSSNGTIEERRQEAEDARQVLGAVCRENLELPDGRLGREDADVRRVVECIRRWRPRTVAAPYWQDRHPDHVAASDLVTRASLASGLRRYEAAGDAWRPEWICYYFINDAGPASFVVDVSDHYETKRRALACHRSQFRPAAPDSVQTRLTTASFASLVESRDAQFGALAGVAFAEGLAVREPVVRPHLLRSWDQLPGRAR